MNDEIDRELRSALMMGKTLVDVLNDIRNKLQGNAPARVLFSSPVTGRIETSNNPFGGDWFDATGYAKLYNSSGSAGYHTGVDLNRPNYADSGAAVCAAADGMIVHSGGVPGWQGNVIVIQHVLEDGARIWTRYAHIDSATNLAGRMVNRSDVIGCIADYNRDGPKGDHLHFDVARIDLGARPDDWPGMGRSRLLEAYIDPAAWLLERRE